MPSARSTSAAARRVQPARTAPRRQRPAPAAPRAITLRSAAARLHWERMGRIALLVVLIAVVGVIAEHALSYVTTRAQDERAQATVQRLQRQHDSLLARERTLTDSASIVRQARRQGMTRPGEQPYVIDGQASR